MSWIKLVTALPAEAKPIVSRFDLQRSQPDLGFPIYRNRNISLIVTGSGKVNAAAGTAFLAALDNHPCESIWVNIGVAGHAERRIGEVLLASCIVDDGSGRVWYPILPDHRPYPADRLLTLDRPDLDYRHGCLVDMEASGFFPNACRWSSAGLVQVLKVVSDNQRNPARGLGAQQVRLLVDEAMEELHAVLTDLEARAGMQRATSCERSAD